MHTTMYKTDKRQRLLHSTGGDIQHLVLTCNGNESGKNVCITESLVEHLSQHNIVNQPYSDFGKKKECEV